MSVHHQWVCDCSQFLCEVTLTILGYLCIIRKYVAVLNGCVKSTLTILGCLCILSLCVTVFNACVKSLWPFWMAVHLRKWVTVLIACVKLFWLFWDVCASSGGAWLFSSLCGVTLTILGYLFILRLLVIVFQSLSQCIFAHFIMLVHA